MLAHYRGQTDVTELHVYNETMQALKLFTACRAQYDTITGLSGVVRLYTGIDRCELKAVMDIYGIKRKRRAALLRQIQLIEQGAREGHQDS